MSITSHGYDMDGVRSRISKYQRSHGQQTRGFCVCRKFLHTQRADVCGPLLAQQIRNALFRMRSFVERGLAKGMTCRACLFLTTKGGMLLITNGDCSAGFGIQPQSQHGDHTVGNCGLLREPHHNQVHRILHGVKLQCCILTLF